MSRLASIAVSIVISSALASAQSVKQLYPVTAPIKDAGVYDMQTGRFTPRSQAAAGGAPQLRVYTNTCNDAAGQMFLQLDSCEDVFDEGRIPASGVPGASPIPAVNTYEFEYCTGVASGSVDLDWELFDTTVGGVDSCTLFSAGPPPDFTQGIVGFDSSAAGFPLPGSTTGGLACWIVAFNSPPVCMFAGSGPGDLFNIRVRSNNTAAQYGSVGQGILVAGDPTATPHADTYNVPPAIDPITGAGCGSGFDTQDLYWDNVDNTSVGAPPSCANGPLQGTNCYWFGGAPTNPMASFYLRIEAKDTCVDCLAPVSYCTAKINSNGCAPTLSFHGPFSISVTNYYYGNSANLTLSNLSEKPNAASHLGQIFWSTSGATGVPFAGGFLCMKGPGIVRIAPPVNYGGVGGGSGCNGSLTQDINPSLTAHSNMAPAGALLLMQGWARDTPGFQGIQLSAALSVTICY